MSAETDKWAAWAKQHKVALGIGAAVVALLAMADSGDQAPVANPDVSGPVAGADTSPGFDKPAWDREQRRDDIEQRNRIDTIREVERCRDADGREYEAPLGTCS